MLFRSPERIVDGAIDGRTDLFSLGVVLYKMLSGRTPFEARTTMAVLAAITTGNPVPLTTVAADVPAGVAALVMRLIAHDTADRPSSVGAVVDEIANLRSLLRGGPPRS